jgi:hypothetical protein
MCRDTYTQITRACLHLSELTPRQEPVVPEKQDLRLSVSLQSISKLHSGAPAKTAFHRP